MVDRAHWFGRCPRWRYVPIPGGMDVPTWQLRLRGGTPVLYHLGGSRMATGADRARTERIRARNTRTVPREPTSLVHDGRAHDSVVVRGRTGSSVPKAVASPERGSRIADLLPSLVGIAKEGHGSKVPTRPISGQTARADCASMGGKPWAAREGEWALRPSRCMLVWCRRRANSPPPWA